MGILTKTEGNRNTLIVYLVFFALLYFAQGAIISYVASLHTLYLLSRGVPLEKVGTVSSVAVIPLVLKLIFGLISDRVENRFGYRKPYICIGMVITAVSMIVFPFIDPVRLYGVALLVAFGMGLGVAIYDTAAGFYSLFPFHDTFLDGLSVDLTVKSNQQREQALIQNVMTGSRAAGLIVVGIILGAIADAGYWNGVFFTLAAFGLLPFVLVFFIKEPEHQIKTYKPKDLKIMIERRYILFGIFGAINFLSFNGNSQIFNPYLHDVHQLSYLTVGFVTGVFGVGQVLGISISLLSLPQLAEGSFLSHALLYKFKAWKCLVIAVVVQAGSGMMLAATAVPEAAWPLVIFFGVGAGLMQATFYATVMKFCLEHIASTMFAVQQSMVTVGVAVGNVSSTAVAAKLTYPPSFILLGALSFVSLPLMPFIFRDRTDDFTFHENEDSELSELGQLDDTKVRSSSGDPVS